VTLVRVERDRRKDGYGYINSSSAGNQDTLWGRKHSVANFWLKSF